MNAHTDTTTALPCPRCGMVDYRVTYRMQGMTLVMVYRAADYADAAAEAEGLDVRSIVPVSAQHYTTTGAHRDAR